jgi:hypothetical protein
MKKRISFFFIFLVGSLASWSQGCIPVRHISGFGQYNFTDNSYITSKWQLNLTNRYFRSFRDYRGSTDLKTPPQNQSVNSVYTFDILISRMFQKGWSIAANLPITSNVRTSSFEHGGANTMRHSTSSFGAGDLRMTVYKWLRDPSPNQTWNIQFGLGIKFPTGDYKYEDYFYRNDTTRVLSPVNPSIQLGDGGTGIITELNGFVALNKTISLYGDFYYLISPRNENGTLYTVGKTPTSIQIQADAVNTSVPDVYSLHAGTYINWEKLTFSAAVRLDGTPVYDLVGASDGTRRAGYYLSVEPGLIYKFPGVTLYTYVPIIVQSHISQNVPDKNITRITGVYTVGPGGSANVVYYLGASFNF